MNTRVRRTVRRIGLPQYLGVCLLLLCGAAVADADIPVEKAGVEVLPDHKGKPWFWVWGNGAPAQIDGRALLFDNDGKLLGELNTGFWPDNLLFSAKRDELFAVETYFSRGLRGTRTDVVTVYDPRTLLAKREIPIPAKRITALGGAGLSVLSDDERFLLVFNYTPAQSISVVDLDASRFVTEVETPGCAAIYPAGSRDFYLLCGDGGFLHLRLDDQGQPALRERIAPVFNPTGDFLTRAASRQNSTWYFVSRDNNVYALDMKSDGLKLADKWSLLSDREREKDWRISGIEHTAIIHSRGQLYVLMHQGKPETQEEPGAEVWVFDLHSHERVQRIKVKELTLSMAVSQGAEPRLYTVDYFFPMSYVNMVWVAMTQGQDALMKVMQQCITIYDAQTGDRLHRIDGLGVGNLDTVAAW